MLQTKRARPHCTRRGQTSRRHERDASTLHVHRAVHVRSTPTPLLTLSWYAAGQSRRERRATSFARPVCTCSADDACARQCGSVAGIDPREGGRGETDICPWQPAAASLQPALIWIMRWCWTFWPRWPCQSSWFQNIGILAPCLVPKFKIPKKKIRHLHGDLNLDEIKNTLRLLSVNGETNLMNLIRL